MDYITVLAKSHEYLTNKLLKNIKISSVNNVKEIIVEDSYYIYDVKIVKIVKRISNRFLITDSYVYNKRHLLSEKYIYESISMVYYIMLNVDKKNYIDTQEFCNFLRVHNIDEVILDKKSITNSSSNIYLFIEKYDHMINFVNLKNNLQPNERSMMLYSLKRFLNRYEEQSSKIYRQEIICEILIFILENPNSLEISMHFYHMIYKKIIEFLLQKKEILHTKLLYYMIAVLKKYYKTSITLDDIIKNESCIIFSFDNHNNKISYVKCDSSLSKKQQLNTNSYDNFILVLLAFLILFFISMNAHIFFVNNENVMLYDDLHLYNNQILM